MQCNDLCDAKNISSELLHDDVTTVLDGEHVILARDGLKTLGRVSVISAMVLGSTSLKVYTGQLLYRFVVGHRPSASGSF